LSVAEDKPPAGSDDSPPRGESGRPKRSFWKRPLFLISLAVLMVGVDAWMVVALDGWKSEAEDLTAEAESLGLDIADVQAQIEGAEAEIAVLDDQREDATAREHELAGETSAETQLTDDIQGVILDLGKCVTDRLKVVRGLWEHGSGYVATLNAQANQNCAAAQSALTALAGQVEAG